MMEEIWKDVKGFEGLYQVSNMGRVRSIDRDIVTTYRGTVHTIQYPMGVHLSDTLQNLQI